MMKSPKGSDVSKQDIDRWNKASSSVKELKDIIDGMRKDTSSLDIPSIKAQVINIGKLVNNCVIKGNFDEL